ncbi:hypothetical protein DAEQUDRAFT_756255 [Daedalea quercina L-15889]|uniref:DNA replication regulator Sld3 C-terminal domain-containing protein n=1 Tax=Daedalea quercina L-15889 TaxID=1314783 RepID=A0A165REH4_9APHY|nr:hypothetical protein DAEQUDRAFT_756255 [Daedalea quercina L-15889]
MVTLLPPAHSLSTECPVKWTVAQERGLNKELECCDCSGAADGVAAYVKQTYLRFLWLPESIMPLRAVVPALLRLQPGLQTSSRYSSSAFLPLRDLLLPFLLTPRTAFQKYHDRMNRMIDNDNDNVASDDEGQMMWLAYRNAKGDEELEAQTQDANGTVSMYDAEEAWKERWLTRMEQREVQIQTILHFLLLSLPGPPASPATNLELELPVYLSSSKKRKRKQKEATPPPSAPELEECVELFMDKLSMWQLMSALDAQDAERQWERSAGAKGKGKGEDERDWMQIFCEDVIELRFKAQLPDLCKLLRSKVFQDSSFTDDPGSPLSTPPASPRPAPKRLKSTASSAQTQHSSTSRIQSRTQDIPPDPHELQRARSRSLSLSLEQERARSLSISAGTRKRTIVREVSMTTAFKGKAQAKAREKQKVAAKAAARKAPPADPNLAKARRTTKGITLVAATPVKPKERRGTSQAVFEVVPGGQAGGQPLPRCELECVAEGDEDDGDLTLSSSPDVLLHGSMPPSQSAKMVLVGALDEDGDEGVRGWMGENAHLALMDTPTKPKHTRR